MALPASAWMFPNNARTKLFQGNNDWVTGAFKLALFTTTSGIGPTSTTYSSLTGEVASGNGYTTGGASVSLALSGTTVIAVNFAAPVIWTGSGSGFSGYYGLLYAVSSSDIICYNILDSTPQNVVIAAGATLTIDNTVIPLTTLS